MTIEEMKAVLEDVRALDYNIEIRTDGDRPYLQLSYLESCVETGFVEEQRGRKWMISTHATKSEIVQTAFKAVATSMEHRAREGFTYRGRRVFGPHYDVDELWRIAEKTDGRE